MIPPPLPPQVWLEFVPVIEGLIIVLGSALALRWLLHTPLGEALAQRIRARGRERGPGTAGRADGSGDPPHPLAAEGRVAALEEQVGGLTSQVSELAERLDFAERLLAERRDRALGARP